MTAHPHIDALAAELFEVFSRTEYALKVAGFNFGDGEAKANWTTFAGELEAFVENPPSPEIAEAINFILTAPPKKQLVSSGSLTWADVPPSTNSKADKLFQYIRRVRNNLFHGGKFNGHWFAPERSEQLLRHSLTVLHGSVAAVPSVCEAYRG